jgi:HrpA-like RNA helicase
MFCCRKQILTAVRNENVLIIAGDTGCGKSTQVPQYLLEAGYKRIGKHTFCVVITIFGVAAW